MYSRYNKNERMVSTIAIIIHSFFCKDMFIVDFPTFFAAWGSEDRRLAPLGRRP